MTIPDAESEVNPYAPVDDVDPPGTEIDVLLPGEYVYGEPILFAGRVNDDDLQLFLKKSAPRGLTLTLLITVFFFAAVYFAAIMWQWQLLLCGIGLVVIAFNVSLSPFYRKREYISCSRTWDAHVTGRFDAVGYHIDDGSSQHRVFWASVSNAYADDEILALQSAMQPKYSRLFKPSMLESAADWDRLVNVAKSIHSEEADSPVVQTRVQNACRELADTSRARILPIPENGVPFSGTLTSDDIPYLQTDGSTQSRWIPIALVVLILVGLAMILSGLTGLMVDDANPLDMTLIYGTVLVAILGAWLWSRSRQLHRADALLFVTGFIEPGAMTLDYRICWRRVRLVSCEFDPIDDDRIVLHDGSTDTNMTLRRDMFGSQSDWSTAVQLASKGTQA